MRTRNLIIVLLLILAMAVLPACTGNGGGNNDTGATEAPTAEITTEAPTNDGNKPEPTPEKTALNVLFIGDSFTQDTLEYLPEMVQSVYDRSTIAYLYLDGTSLADHATNATQDLASYTLYVSKNGTAWGEYLNVSIATALKYADWNYVGFNQQAGDSGNAESYDPHLTTLISTVKTACPDAKLAWNMTWAYAANYTDAQFDAYNNDQTTMYNAIAAAVQNVIGDTHKDDFAKVIPAGTAIQNARTSYLGDKLCRDGSRLNLGVGRYTAALSCLFALSDLEVKKDDLWRPLAVDLNDFEFEVAWDAANAAKAAPYAVTQSTVTEGPQLEESGRVYISDAGDDTNDGSRDNPVKTLLAAYKLLGAEGGTVTLIGDVTVSTEYRALCDYGAGNPQENVTITSDGDAKLIISGSGIWFFGDTTLENLNIECAYTAYNVLFVANCHKFVVGEGVNITLAAGAPDYPIIYGGGYYSFKFIQENMNSEVIVKSGKFAEVYGGSGVHHDGWGHIDDIHGTTTVLIEGGEIGTVYGGNNGGVGGDGPIVSYGDVSVTVSGGKIGAVVANGKTDNTGIEGNVSVTVTGGEIEEIVCTQWGSENDDKISGTVTLTCPEAYQALAKGFDS